MVLELDHLDTLTKELSLMTKTFKVKNKLLSTVEITVKEFSLTHIMHNVWQKFRESSCFTKDGTKELISRNIFGEREFHFFPHCGYVI